jgi:rod shape-determining protein MreD
MKYLLWALVIFTAFAVQASISIFDVTPNLTVILAFYVGMKKGEVRGMLIGSLIGIIEDSFSGAFLGPHLLGKGLVGHLASLIYSGFFIWTPLLGIVSMAVLTLMDSLIVFASRSIFDMMPGSYGALFSIVIVQSLLNAPFGIFIKPQKTE